MAEANRAGQNAFNNTARRVKIPNRGISAEEEIRLRQQMLAQPTYTQRTQKIQADPAFIGKAPVAPVTMADMIRIQATRRADPSLMPEQQAIRAGVDRELTRGESFADKFSTLFKRGELLATLDKAIADASDIPDRATSDKAVGELSNMRDTYLSATGISPIEGKNVFEKLAFGAAPSVSEMGRLILREAIVEGVVAIGGVALTALTSGADAGTGAAAAVVSGGKLVNTGRKMVNILRGMGAAARSATKVKGLSRLVHSVDAVNDARKAYGALGMTGKIADKLARRGPSLLSFAKGAVSMMPVMKQGRGQIYGEMYREGIPQDIARPASYIGGTLYGLIEGVLSPLGAVAGPTRLLTKGVATAVRKGLMNAVGKGTANGIKNLVAKMGMNALTEWAEEGAQSVALNSTLLTARQFNKHRLVEAHIIDGIENAIKANGIQDGWDVVEKGWEDMKDSIWGVLGMTIPLSLGGGVIDISSAKAVGTLEKQLAKDGITPESLTESRAQYDTEAEYLPNLKEKMKLISEAGELGLGGDDFNNQIINATTDDDNTAVAMKMSAARKQREIQIDTEQREKAEVQETERVANEEKIEKEIDRAYASTPELVKGALIGGEDMTALETETQLTASELATRRSRTVDTVKEAKKVLGMVEGTIQDATTQDTKAGVKKIQKELAKVVGKAEAERISNLVIQDIADTAGTAKAVAQVVKAITEGKELGDGLQGKYDTNKKAVDKKMADIEADKLRTEEEKQAIIATKEEARAFKAEVKTFKNGQLSKEQQEYLDTKPKLKAAVKEMLKRAGKPYAEGTVSVGHAWNKDNQGRRYKVATILEDGKIEKMRGGEFTGRSLQDLSKSELNSVADALGIHRGSEALMKADVAKKAGIDMSMNEDHVSFAINLATDVGNKARSIGYIKKVFNDKFPDEPITSEIIQTVAQDTDITTREGVLTARSLIGKNTKKTKVSIVRSGKTNLEKIKEGSRSAEESKSENVTALIHKFVTEHDDNSALGGELEVLINITKSAMETIKTDTSASNVLATIEAVKNTLWEFRQSLANHLGRTITMADEPSFLGELVGNVVDEAVDWAERKHKATKAFNDMGASVDGLWPADDYEVEVREEEVNETMLSDKEVAEELGGTIATDKDLIARGEEIGIVKQLAKDLKLDVVFTTGGDSAYYGGKAYLATTNSSPLLGIFGHELSHSLDVRSRKKADKLYAVLMQKYPDLIAEAKSQYKELSSDHWDSIKDNPQMVRDEIRATVIEKAFNDPKFWDEAKKNLDASLWNTIVKLVKNFLSKINGMSLDSDSRNLYITISDYVAALTQIEDPHSNTAIQRLSSDNSLIADAKKAGYTVGPVAHGGRGDQTFTKFDIDRMDLGAHFGTDKAAEHFGGTKRSFMLKIDNPLRLPDMGTWTGKTMASYLQEHGFPMATKQMSKAQLRKMFSDAGYDGIVYMNRGETGVPYEEYKERTRTFGTSFMESSDARFKKAFPEAVDSYIVFEPNKIKLIDDVTKDDAGNIIPPSQRFNTEIDDIRYLPTKEQRTGKIVNDTYTEDGNRDDYSRTEWARQMDETVHPTRIEEETIRAVVGEIKKTTTSQNLLQRIGDKTVPMFKTLATSLSSIAPSVRNLFIAQEGNTQNRAWGVMKKTFDYILENHDTFVDADFGKAEPIIASDGVKVPYWKRGHTASMYGYVKQARLAEVMEAYDDGGDVAVQNKIEDIAFALSNDVKEQKWIAINIEKLVYAFAGTPGKSIIQDDGTIETIPQRNADGSLKINPKKLTKWHFPHPPGGLVKQIAGKATTAVVLDPRKMIEIAKSADAKLVASYKPYRHLSDKQWYPAIADEWANSHPKVAFHKNILDQMPMVRQFDTQTHSEKRVNQLESDKPADIYGNYQANNTYKELFLDNIRNVKPRSYAESDMVLYQLPELIIKQANEVKQYQYNSLVMTWKNAIRKNAPALREVLSENEVKQMMRILENMEGTIDDTQDVFTEMINKAMGKYGKVILQSPWVMLYQPVSLTSAEDVIDKEYIHIGIKQKLSRQGKDILTSVLGEQNYLYMRRTLGRIETQYDDDSMYTASFNSAANIHKPGLKGKVKDLGGWLSKGLTLTDSQAIDTIILGAYAQITAENPSMSKEKAIHYAGNLAVMATNLTQVSSETAHMSPIRSSKSAIARVLSFMTGATSQAWNVAERRYSALRHAIATGDKQEMAAAYGKMLSVVRVLALQAVAIGAVKTLRSKWRDEPDDDDKKKFSALRKLTINSADSILGYLPGSSTYSPLLMSKFAKGLGDADAAKRFGFRSGRTPHASMIAPVQKMGRGMEQIWKAMGEEKSVKRSEALERGAKNTYTAMGSLIDVWGLGVNLTGITRDITKIKQHVLPKQDTIEERVLRNLRGTK